MVGEMARQYRATARMVAEQGHEVADHTMTHPQAPQTSRQRLRQEVQGAAKLLEEITGKKVRAMGMRT